MIEFPYEAPAILVQQPLGSFYLVNLPARLLLEVCFSDVLRALGTTDPVHPYTLDGTQRETQQRRLSQIGAYIDRDDAAFPNTIILAANIRPEDGLIEASPDEACDLASLPGASEAELKSVMQHDRPNRRWKVIEKRDGCARLIIPSRDKLAAVIDGQHRLWGFTHTKIIERLEMEMSCAVYMDLPKPFQAQIFATINSNQKRVDKSLTYELFGYNIEDEPPELWAPDKLAVFLTRRLGADPLSPLHQRISIAARTDETLRQQRDRVGWKVSTAVVVDGILRLISSNPKSDANAMLTPKRSTRSTLIGIGARKDQSPLRQAYAAGQDAVLYQLVLNFLSACEQVFWEQASPDSFITKTVGIQALFDILRTLAGGAYSKKVISAASFTEVLAKAGAIDFARPEFRNASGSGRSIIRREIEARINSVQR